MHGSLFPIVSILHQVNENLLTGRGVFLDVRNPVLSGLEAAVSLRCRPGSLDQVSRSLSFEDDFVAEAAGFSQHFYVQRICQISAVHDRNRARVLVVKSDSAARLGSEQLCNDAESVVVVDRELVILLRATVAFRREEFNVGLRRGEAHRIAAGLTWC